VDRAKNGCKRHVIGEAQGIPLLVECTPANVRDDTVFVAMLDSLPPVKMAGSGPPRYKPGTAAGDAAYGHKQIIKQVVERRIRPLLAPRGTHGHPVEHGSGLGKVRYVIERSLAWLANFRRIAQCYEATGASWQAFNDLACCVICAQRIRKIQTQKVAA
jgi:transposase